MDGSDVRADVDGLVAAVSKELGAVLVASGLPENLQAKYTSIVHDNIDGLGL